MLEKNSRYLPTLFENQFWDEFETSPFEKLLMVSSTSTFIRVYTQRMLQIPQEHMTLQYNKEAQRKKNKNKTSNALHNE